MNTPDTPDPEVQSQPGPAPEAPKPASPNRLRPGPGGPEAAADKPAPRRRWKKILLISGGVVAGLILLVIVLGPPVVSTVAKSKIQSILGDKLQSDVTVGSVSFSWSGRLAVEDFRIVPRGFASPLFEVKKVDVHVSVGSAIGGKYIARIEVVAPKVIVEKDERGKFNYEFPPSPPEPEAPKKEEGPSKKPFVQAELVVHDGEVLIRAKGRETVYRNLTVSAKVDTLEKPVEYSLSFNSPAKDKLLVRGAYDIDKMAGPATVLLEQISLKNLTAVARAYSDVLELDGTVTGVLEYQLKGKLQFGGKAELRIANFSAVVHDPVLKRDQTLKLDQLTFVHEGGLDDRGNGRHTFILTSGKALGSQIVADVTDAFGARAVKTDIRFDSDLGALTALLRNLGSLPSGTALEGALSLRGRTESKGPTDADLKANTPRIPVQLELELVGSNLAVTTDGKPMKLDRFTLSHKGALDEKGDGRHTIALKLGKAVDASITADVTDALGKPGVKAEITTESDLGALAAMLPGMIELKPGTDLAGSAGLSARVETRGDAWAKFDVSATLANLESVEKATKKRQEIDRSVVAKVKGLWEGNKKALNLESFTLGSSFASADARGGFSLKDPITVEQSSLQLKADLEKLGAKLSLFMADAPSLTGTATVTGKYAGDRYDLDAAVKGVKIVTRQVVKEGGKEVTKTVTMGPIDATVVQRGTLSTAKDGGFRIEACKLTSSAVSAEVTGEIRKVMEESREGELKLDASLRPVELSKWVQDLGMGGPEIKLATTVGLKPKLITVAGQTKLDGLTMTGKDEKGASVTKTAKTQPLEFTVQMKDKDILAKAKTALFEWVDKGYGAKGGLETEITYTEKGTTGTTKLTSLEIVDDKKNTVKEPAVTIVHDVAFGSFDIRKAEITSGFLRGSVTGKIRNLEKEPEFLGLKGTFKYAPDRLGAVLAPWLPGKLEGKEEKTISFQLDGKAKSAGVLAILRGSQGAVDLDLAKFTTDGVTVSGKTRLDLKDGRMATATPLEVNKGKTDLNTSVDFREPKDKPQSRLDFVAKEVDANGAMGPLLEKINPIFHTSGVDAKVDGQIQSDFKLVWNGAIDLDEKDWAAAASKSLVGGGVFGVKNMNIAGSPTVGQIMSALGAGNALQGELVGTQIRMAEGKCLYENMTVRSGRKDPGVLQRDQERLNQEKQQLAADQPRMSPAEFKRRQDELRLKEEDLPYRYVLRFSGWVGFNKKMEMRVLMPMSENLSKAHPSLAKYIGTSFWVDLKGTVDSPSLDTRKMVEEAIKRAAEGVIKDKAADLLERLLEKKKKDK